MHRSGMMLACLFAAAMTLIPLDACAHAISVINADVFVETGKVSVCMNVFVEEIIFQYQLEADAENRFRKADIDEYMDQYSDILLSRLVIRDKDGMVLKGKQASRTLTKQSLDGSEVLEDQEVPEQGLLLDELMSFEINYYLEYRLERPLEYLAFQQLWSSGSTMPVVFNLTVSRAGLPPEEPALMNSSDQIEIYRFDWTEKGKGGEHSYDEWTKRTELHDGKMLGINSYSSLYTFIYIERSEIRVETLVPVVGLKTWIDIKTRDPDFVEIDEQNRLKTDIEKLLSERIKVKADRETLEPVTERIDFFGVDFRDFARRAEPSRQSLWSSRAGIIQKYPVRKMPESVEIGWDLLGMQYQTTAATIFAPDRDERHQFSYIRPDFVWKSDGPPLLSDVEPVKIDGGKLKTDIVMPAMAQLLTGIYSAFLFPDDEDIYDALSRNVDGDLLADVYIRIKKSLIMQEQGNSASRIKKVDVTKCEAVRIDGKSLSLNVTWEATGTVEHWGHIHTRVNEYQAGITAEIQGDMLKITGLKPLSQQRKSYKIGVRKIRE